MDQAAVKYLCLLKSCCQMKVCFSLISAFLRILTRQESRNEQEMKKKWL